MKRFLSVLLALSMLLCALSVTSFAEETVYTADDVLTFEGLSYRTTDDHGIRAMFRVNQDAVDALTAEGYTVRYGAIMAIHQVNKPADSGQAASTVTYNESVEDLMVAVIDGSVVLLSGTNAAFISSDNGLKYLDENRNTFAYTTVYNVSLRDLYYNGLRDTKLFYRGFTILTDAYGANLICYDDLTYSNAALNAPTLQALYKHVLSDKTANLPYEVTRRLEIVYYAPWSPPIH